MNDRLRELAERRLPEIDALIERAQRVRTWLQDATRCDCQRIDDCTLFDDPALPAANDARAWPSETSAFGDAALNSAVRRRAQAGGDEFPPCHWSLPTQHS